MGKSGGELQQEDIRLLRRELAAKQEKLNELRRATHDLSDMWVLLEGVGPLLPPAAGCAPFPAGSAFQTPPADTPPSPTHPNNAG